MGRYALGGLVLRLAGLISFSHPNPAAPANMLCRVRQESKIPGSLEFRAQHALMPGTDTGSMAKLHLPAVGDEAT